MISDKQLEQLREAGIRAYEAGRLIGESIRKSFLQADLLSKPIFTDEQLKLIKDNELKLLSVARSIALTTPLSIDDAMVILKDALRSFPSDPSLKELKELSEEKRKKEPNPFINKKINRSKDKWQR